MRFVSVLLATHNGANVLPRSLEGYVRLAEAAEHWKLIVANNASSDGTKDILESFKPRLPLTVVDVPTPGKNRALNAALDHVEGDLIVLTDDDAIPSIGFLNAWRDAAQRLPDFDVIGGEIELEFDRQPPNWLLSGRHRFEELYAFRKNVAEGAIDPHGIYGPNMAVRRRVFDLMQFDESIGPDATNSSYGMGSETEFCLRAKSNGFRTGFAAGPQVHHIVREHQVLPEFWEGRAFRLGKGAAQQQWGTGVLRYKDRSVLVRLLSNCLYFVRYAWLYSLASLPGESGAFHRRWRFQFFKGFQTMHRERKRAAAQALGKVL